MKKLFLPAFIGITTLLSGCTCECADDIPSVRIQFEGFNAAELENIYVINPATSDTCTTCLFSGGNSAQLWVTSNTQYQLTNNSGSLNKVIQVNNIRSETTNRLGCDCTDISIDYELDGNQYTDGQVVIAK